MTSTAFKFAYCAVLLMLAVFVAIPPRKVHVVTAEAVSAPLSTESRLAKAIHARITIEAEGQPSSTSLVQLAAEEDGLRQLAFAGDAQGAREQLIDCLADELSAAMLQRSEIDAPGNTGERDRMEAVVRALTAAINAEVRGVTA